MNSRSSIPSTVSVIGEFETEAADPSLRSEDSLALAGFRWELKDLLNIDDNDGSNCLDVEGTPVKAAGSNDRFGTC